MVADKITVQAADRGGLIRVRIQVAAVLEQLLQCVAVLGVGTQLMRRGTECADLLGAILTGCDRHARPLIPFQSIGGGVEDRGSASGRADGFELGFVEGHGEDRKMMGRKWETEDKKMGDKKI